ncbi:hypothetical protein [uncultured Massilia sp.]|uniref:hypothetical protein n=1 Tax=uncultured Massilia sp. TaxID=169973 RepID=UPI0025EAD634|nr:hypothetical protein [uncultured Massilia sp.]
MSHVHPASLAVAPAALRPSWFAAPALAAVYPYVLAGFHGAASAIAVGAGWEAWLAAATLLLAANVLPLLALALAVRLGREPRPSAAQLLARRVALLAVGVPPLFTLAGVVFMLLGHPAWDLPFTLALWGALALAVALAPRSAPPVAPAAAGNGRWRVAHGIAAVVAVLYLCAHLANHMVGWIGPDAHAAVMKVLRTAYRSRAGEPLLIGAFGFLIVSGALMAWRLTGRASDAVRTFQVAGGVFLVFAVVSHVNAVLYLARVVLRIDSDWGFGVGAPNGLLKDAWNIRLLPYYLLAVFFAIAHAFCGLRGILLAHGKGRRLGDRVLAGGTVFAATVAILITMAMCGLRIHVA